VLLLYSGVVSLLLSLASRGTAGIISFVPALVVFVLSVSAISSALFLLDKKTLASFRRTDAVLVAGGILWLFCAGCGILYSRLTESAYAMNNAILFGAFLCAGLEFLVINGTFTQRAPIALGLAVIHPASTLAILRYSELSSRLDMSALLLGVSAFLIFAVFTYLLKTKKTSLGFSALSLFQAFMKTWANGDAADLEAIVSAHSEDADVTTKVLRFHTMAGDTFVVLPGVHPGPFHPVGSYDLPGVISRAFKGLGPVMTLHRPGGHERNLATSAETARYAGEAGEFARGIQTSQEALARGPSHAKIGKTNVSSTAFSKDLLLTLSFAPLGSDDLSTEVESALSGPASAAGFEASIVDAHNSIDDRQESPDTGDPGWIRLLDGMKSEKASPFKVGYAHSSEVGFAAQGDLTENGIGLLMLETDLGKAALVLADANNAVPTLREQTARALESLGYGLIELCTSDTHNLAARGLTVSRGYKALGESTPPGTISNAVGEIAKLADGRLAPSAYGSGQLTSRVKVFGTRALEEFAGVTQASSRLGRAYLRFAITSSAVLLLLSLAL
jgi:putative membrane protein